MHVKIKYFNKAMFFLLLTLAVYSCKKNQPTCSGNCVNINITGRSIIKTSGSPLINIPVDVNWYRKGYCIGCTSYKVVAGTTDNEGKFNFTATIDTSFFSNYYLSVQLPVDTNYITDPANSNANFYEKRIYDFDANGLQNLQFESYPKTYLTIKLNRTQADNFNFFSVNHNFSNLFGYGDYVITGSQFAIDTSFTVPTAADIFTRVVWKKTVNGTTANEQTDSLICTKNGANIFTINY